MTKRYIIDKLTLVVIRETVEVGRKFIKLYEGVIYRENFKKTPFRKIKNKFFTLKQKYRDEIKVLQV